MLRLRGFPALKAQVWSEFVHHVLSLYWEATDQLLEPQNWAEFKEKLGALGKAKVKNAQTVQFPIEDAITSEIGYRAELLRKCLPPGHFLRRHEVSFAYEALVYSEERAGRHSKKVDFRVFSSLNKTAPEIAIEAKPITTTADIASRYLAAEGLGCFFKMDSPYTKGPLGAMLAYTMNSAGESMLNEISKALSLGDLKPLSVDRVLASSAGDVDCSYHDRSIYKLDPISIFHLERNFPI
jgi:hypothetical protein